MGKIIIPFLIFFLVAVAQAEVIIKTKGGNTLKWKSFFEEGNNYCTWNQLGKFCIPKDTVTSISGESDGYTPLTEEEILQKKAEAELEKSKAKAKAIEALEQQKKLDPLKKCLESADNQYRQEWDRQCYKIGRAANCALPTESTSIFDQRFRDYKDECYKIYDVITK